MRSDSPTPHRAASATFLDGAVRTGCADTPQIRAATVGGRGQITASHHSERGHLARPGFGRPAHTPGRMPCSPGRTTRPRSEGPAFLTCQEGVARCRRRAGTRTAHLDQLGIERLARRADSRLGAPTRRMGRAQRSPSARRSPTGRATLHPFYGTRKTPKRSRPRKPAGPGVLEQPAGVGDPVCREEHPARREERTARRKEHSVGRKRQPVSPELSASKGAPTAGRNRGWRRSPCMNA